MTINVPALVWKVYQGGKPGTLISQMVIDSTIDTDYRIPINAIYQLAPVTASRVVVDNTANNATVMLTIGGVLANIPPFTRDYLDLDKDVGLNLQITITAGSALVTFCKGDVPFNVSLSNYYGAANAVVPNLTPASNALLLPVTLAVGGTFYTGPTINVGNVGTWYASGTVSIHGLGTSSMVFARLTDGVTVFATAASQLTGANGRVSISVSGFIVAPVGPLVLQAMAQSGPNGQEMEATFLGVTDLTNMTTFRVA